MGDGSVITCAKEVDDVYRVTMYDAKKASKRVYSWLSFLTAAPRCDYWF